MAIHVYIKEKNSVKKKTVNLVSYLSLTVGSLLMFWSFYPIVSFEIYSRIFLKKKLSTPIANLDKVPSLDQANSVLGVFNVFSNNLRDYTKASIWFPSKVESAKAISPPEKIKEYLLSIPKLNIKDARVVVGGEDLSKSLIHYLPQSYPGENGNVVIFGHSTLPQLYDPEDYKTIFTYLPSLEKGDKIQINIGGIQYQYEIYSSSVVKPTDISVLDQRFDSSYLTLITCVPPGTYWERLVLRAKLTQI